ncbi:MAG TPA: Gfo/Idh/MocA family oxidoreductase [Terriglobales bacterium]|nr:Gfo/Idh/MocA family oxidoreductase [Terriglobales bacterium]
MVGAGQIARDRHVPGFKRIPGVDLVAVVNRKPESSRRAAEEHGFLRTHADWRDLVADPEVDAVVIGTWPYLHAPITIAALDAGRHVLTEARMAMDAQQARAMLAASLAHPELVAMVVPSPLLWADRTIERLLAEGAVGQLRSASAVWSERSAHGSRLHWRQQVELSGSNVMSLGIVYETMARWLGQAMAVQAAAHVFDPVKERADGGRATVGVPDQLNLVAEFPGPLLATLEMATGAAFDERVVHLRGTGGTLRVDFSSGRIELATGAEGYRPVEVRPGEAGEWRVEQEFIGAIRGENEVRLTDFATGAAYMAFTDAVRRSALEGRRVPIGSGL